MLRHRDWTTATLRELGGFEGIGVMFLEETFSAPTAPPAHRAAPARGPGRAQGAPARALLGPEGPDAAGAPCSARPPAMPIAPADFAELMAILDNELRMVASRSTLRVRWKSKAIDGQGAGSQTRNPAARPSTISSRTIYLVPPHSPLADSQAA